MSKDKAKKYGSAYIPEPPKESRKRSAGGENGGRIREIEDAIEEIKNSMIKSNRDNLDAMYNIDVDNLDVSFRRLLQSYSDGIVEANASVVAWADATEAGFKAVAEWQDETNKSVADVQGTANANGAAITSLVQFQKKVEDGTIESIASVSRKADENSADILLLAQWKSTADSDIDALAESMAVIEATANDNEASISQIVTAVGKNGDVTAASIVSAVNSAGSSVKISADHVDIDGIARFTNVSGSSDSITTVDGSKIALIADEYGDSISRLEFGKYKYSTDTLENYTFDSMLHIKTIDNERDNENLARFAAVLQTYTASDPDTGDNYETALKLISCGDMSMEADGLIYMSCSDYMTVDPGYNLRIRANRTYSTANRFHPSTDDTYMFCSNGIYFGSTMVVNPDYEFTATGIYYNGTKIVST